jgi:hypothetical protein
MRDFPTSRCCLVGGIAWRLSRPRWATGFTSRQQAAGTVGALMRLADVSSMKPVD